MKKSVTIIAGDGVGPEVVQQSIKVLDAVAVHFGHEFNYTNCLMGTAALKQTGKALPNNTIETCLETDAILLGTITSSKHTNGVAKGSAEQSLQRLKKMLGLFANVRPVKVYPSLHHLSPLKTKVIEGVDLVIFQEQTGGIYSGENKTTAGQNSATDKYNYTEQSIERIAHLAFKTALQRKQKLTLVDKANVLETSKLWRKVVKDIAPQYATVQVNFLLVENAITQLMLTPKQFDVLLTDKLSGDILNEASTVIGGCSGLLAAASMGNSNAMFSPVHGFNPLIAGKDIANPLGSILSAAMMLDYFNLKEEAQLVRDAVQWTIESLFVSKDIDPINFYFTSTIGELVSEYIGGRISGRVNKENIELRKSTII